MIDRRINQTLVKFDVKACFDHELGILLGLKLSNFWIQQYSAPKRIKRYFSLRSSSFVSCTVFVTRGPHLIRNNFENSY